MNDYKEKFITIIGEDWSFKNDEVLEEKYIEFLQSLSLLSNSNFFKKSTDFDNKISFFKDIVGIEMLIRNNRWYNPVKEEFSIRAARLLGSGFIQRVRLQNYFGALYDIRSSIVHQFEIRNIRSTNYKRYLKKDFNHALLILNKFHQLILLRVISNDNKIITKDEIIRVFNELEIEANNKDANLKRLKTYDGIKKRNSLIKLLTIPESKYLLRILDEVTNITGFKSDLEFDKSINKKFYDENYLLLAIDSYGGLTEFTNHNLDFIQFFHFSENGVLLSDKKDWLKIRERIIEELEMIFKSSVKEIILFLKAHLSILVYFGYNFNRQNKQKNNKTLVSFFINQKKQDIEEFYFDLNVNKRIVCTVPDIKIQPTEAILLINISHEIEIFKEAIKCLPIKDMPLLLYQYNKNELYNEKFIEHSGKIKEFLLAIKNDLQKRNQLKKVHLISRLPDVMMIFLGMILNDLNLQVFLYEKIEESEKLINVLDCK